ncbi:MAG: hypothetical protein F4018_16065 [Acidobacteria bacterium]|nr:hypothetical protein [Acidobacteriota bacterium]MYH27734.1 hypothetical protein [Acidobacteriota bacterium]MYK89723.1 hypothetical protein [Acidobacteriota bacterium]
MPETNTGAHCHYCHAGEETTRLRLRHACTACDRRISEHRLYFRIPKPFTLAGLRTQARGFRLFLQAACASAAGRTPAARQRGRLFSLKLAATVWIDQWYVLESAGWRR